MKNYSFKDILNLQVNKVYLTMKLQKENKNEPIHYGVIVSTIENQEQYLLHNGYKFGKDQDFIITNINNISNDWEIYQNYQLDKPIQLSVLFSAGCCGQNMRYHPQNNNSKHAQDRIIKKVKEYVKSKQNIG